MALSFSARPATMRSPKPPAPMNAAMVAVPTLMTAAVLTPARGTGSASGNSTSQRLSRGQPERERRHRSPAGTPASPACVLRTIGSSA